MSFVCPECLMPGTLEITRKLELPPDSSWDEIALQIVECSHCSFRGAAVYTESRRGALDSEVWNHTGYRIDEEKLATLQTVMEQCPAPSNSRCQCSTHQLLGQRSPETGQWKRVKGFDQAASFPMRLMRTNR